MRSDDARLPLPELFVAEHRGRYILHAPLHFTTCRINRSLFEQIRAAQNGDLGAQEVVLAELAPWGLAEPRSAEALSSDTATRPCAISLLLTERCNLRCSYCYADGGSGTQTLPLGAGTAGVDLIVRNAVDSESDQITLHLHGGGEVSLVWDLARRLIDHALEQTSRHGLTLRVTAGTNGVMSAARAHQMAEALDEATISIDGLPTVHNRQRPAANGASTFGTVVRTVEIFAARDVASGLRLTVTPESVDELPAGVALLCERLSSRLLQVEPAYPLGRHAGHPSVDAHRFVDRFRTARRAAAAAGRDLRYSGARYPHLTDVFCRAVTGAICVTPGGKVTACYEAGEDPSGRFTFGRYDPGSGRLEIDPERQRGLLRLSVHHLPECDRCIAKYHCAGDCPMKRTSISANGKLPARCVINRELTADQILDELEGQPRLGTAPADGASGLGRLS